jgi:ABC-type nitrate/sulfonate/bicarbonate transport system substrate-binding protein
LAKNELLTSGRYGHCAHAKFEQLFPPSSVVQDIDDDKAVTRGFKKFALVGDLVDIPTSGLIASRQEVANHRDRVQKTIAALLDAVTWIRANRVESVRMIADKFKITSAEAERTYETYVSMFNKDGRLPPKVARGYLDLLRQERPVPADLDSQKLVDFSMLPGGK